MAIQVDINNFRSLGNAHLHDNGKMSVIVGRNESGKSSFIGAVQYAFTGAAFGHRGKDAEALVKRGEEKMSVRVRVGSHLVGRTKTTGDAIKGIAERMAVPLDCLPLLFDAKLNGDGGSKAMRTFLNGVASSLFDPGLHFANDPVVKNAIEMAKRSGRITTKQIVEYCESMRAQQKEPSAPLMPSTSRITDDALKAQSELTNQAHDKWQVQLKEYGELATLTKRFSQIALHAKNMKQYRKDKKAAAKGDPLKSRREALVKLASINLTTLKGYSDILKHAGDFTEIIKKIDRLQVVLEATREEAAKILLENPAPNPEPIMPQLEQEARTVLNDSGGDEFLNDNLEIEKLLSSSMTEANKAAASTSLAQGEHDACKEQLEAMQRNRGAWDAYDRSLLVWEENKVKLAAEWDRWDRAAKEIAQAEVEHVNKAGDAFGKMVAEFSGHMLQGRQVKVSWDEGIFLGPDHIDDLSDSTKWRIEVAVMAAVARTLRAPLLLLDGADILDDKNRGLVSNFLIQQIMPHFEHIIITSTPKTTVEEEKAPINEGISKWILEGGELTKLETKK